MKQKRLFHWILLLLATFLWSDHVVSHSQSPKACGHRGIMLPIDKMAHGVDLTELELFPMSLNVQSRPPLFDLTCNGNRKFTHPGNETRVFNQPDQFDTVYPVASDDSFSIGTTIYRNSRIFKMQRKKLARLNLNLPWYGAFSANARLMDLQRTLYRDNKTVGEAFTTHLALYAHLNDASNLKLSGDFQRLLPNVSSNVPSYEESPQVYDTLVNTMGTHYFISAYFGGRLTMKAIIEEAYTRKHSEGEINRNMKSALHQMLKLPPHGGFNLPPVTARFWEASHLDLWFYGGFLNLGNDWAIKWREQVFMRPVILTGFLEPIETLIANPKIKVEVAKATTLKMAKAYLSELKNLIEMGNFKLTDIEQKTLNEAEIRFNPRNIKMISSLSKLLEAIFIRLEKIEDFDE